MKTVSLKSLTKDELEMAALILSESLAGALGGFTSYFESVIGSFTSTPSFVIKNPKGEITAVYLLKFASPDLIVEKKAGFRSKQALQGYALGIGEKYRSQGIGRSLDDQAVKIAKTNGCDLIWGLTHANLGAIGFWKKMGRESFEYGSGYLTYQILKKK